MWRGAILIFVLFIHAVRASELKRETLDAWEDYTSGADKAMQERVACRRSFLWSDETPARSLQLRGGLILASPATEHTPQRVPSGLVHHWIGAVFIPDASVDDVLAILRGYSRYKEFYSPAVIDSKSLGETESEDRFSLVLMNRAVLVHTALDTDEQSRYVRVDARHAYGISRTTRVQEIQDYGQASQRKLPPDRGSGYLWRLHSITRLEERDGGVYMEVEALALIRYIPAAFRFMVDPIVRRVSKSSITTSLRQTQDAVASVRSKSVSPDRRILLR